MPLGQVVELWRMQFLSDKDILKNVYHPNIPFEPQAGSFADAVAGALFVQDEEHIPLYGERKDRSDHENNDHQLMNPFPA